MGSRVFGEIIIHKGDLPEGIVLEGDLSIDTETLGLNIKRDRLCLVQLCDEKRDQVHLVQFHNNSSYHAPVLSSYLINPKIQKIFHFARFDLASLRYYLGIESIPNVFCTRTASIFGRTYTDKHGLKSVVMDLLGIELKKEQQSSYWGAEVLSEAQQLYAKNDVFYLHQIRAKLITILKSTGRQDLCENYCNFLHHIVDADLLGFTGDLFAHTMS